MADIQYWDDTLSEELETIRSLLDSVPRMPSETEKAAALDRADKKLRSANQTKRSYKMECRLVGDPSQRQRYENRLAKHEEALAALGNDVRALRSDAQRGRLFDGATDDAAGNATADPEATGDYLLNEANKLQDKTAESLQNTRNMVAASKEVGMQTMEELERQRAQIESIDREAMRMEDNLARADKLIKTFGRRMATDKFIQCCACLNVLLLVGVVVYSIFKGGGLPGQRDAGQPASPVRMLVRTFLRGASSFVVDAESDGVGVLSGHAADDPGSDRV